MTKQEMNRKLLSYFHNWEDLGNFTSSGGIEWGDGYNWYVFDFFTTPPKNIFDIIEKHKISIVKWEQFWSSKTEGTNGIFILASKTYVEALAKILIKIGEENGNI
ncbi:hypothetical protein SJ_18 [Proteus phage SJ_PmiM]|nr:hypothetical protein SJ_18 [Proteus phage SJ_PmiM]